MSRNIDTPGEPVKRTRHDFTIEFRELRALLKTALEIGYDLEHRGAGEGSRPSSPVAPDSPAVTYAIRHALEVLGDAGFDEDIRRAALAELDDVEDAITALTRDRDRAVAALEHIEDVVHKARYGAPRRAMTTGGLPDEAFWPEGEERRG